MGKLLLLLAGATGIWAADRVVDLSIALKLQDQARMMQMDHVDSDHYKARNSMNSHMLLSVK